jgi:hypothetical protein
VDVCERGNHRLLVATLTVPHSSAFKACCDPEGDRQARLTRYDRVYGPRGQAEEKVHGP